MLNYHLIGKRIKEMRKMRKITQSKLAELTNLSVSYVNYIENGKRKTSLQTLVMIADVMEITVDILLAGNQSYSRGEYKNDIFLLIRRALCSPKIRIVTTSRNLEERTHCYYGIFIQVFFYRCKLNLWSHILPAA